MADNYNLSYTRSQVDTAIGRALNPDTTPTSGHTTKLVTSHGVAAKISELSDSVNTQVTQIGSKLGDLTQLQTTDKSSLVNALNEVKNNAKSAAGDVSYVDNQGLGSTNVQGALDKLGAENKKLYDYDTISCADLDWYSGNFNGYTYVSTYANMVTDYIDVSGYDSLNEVHITNTTTFNITLLCFTSEAASGGVAKVYISPTSTNTVIDLAQYGTKFIRLVCWDKPTQAQAMAETFTMSFQVSKIDALESQVNANTQSLQKSITLSASNGDIIWAQGGINGTTGKVESNAKAIHSQFIKVYKNDVLSPLSYTNTIANNLAYALYDSSFTKKVFAAARAIDRVLNYLDTDYGYIRLCFYGSNAIDKTSDNATTAVWNITRNTLDYLNDNGKEYFQNPIYWGSCPDPCIVDGGDGYWYCFRTCGSGGTLLKSSNLIDWEIGESFLSDSATATLSALYQYFWAPEVKKIGDFWTMYISAGVNGMFVLKSRNIWGKYEIVNNISSSLTTTTQRIDACVEYDEDGQLWLFWGSIGGICRARLNADGTDFLEGEVPEKITPTTSTNANGWEGTYLYRRNGYWYLFCSNGQYGNYTYNIQVVRSETLAGSFVDKDGNTFLEGNATRILYSESGDELYGPGHNGAIIVDKSNRTWMFFHSHVLGTDSTSTRCLCVDEVHWGDDGWPYFEDGKPSIELKEKPFTSGGGSGSGGSSVVDNALSSTSKNAVQNKVIKAALDVKIESATINNIVTLSQSDYDALAQKDSATLYVIV